jgi:hypothetical protein
LAKIASSEIVNKNVLFNFAVSGDAQFIRSYMEGGKPVDKDTQAALDVLFNAWLSTQQLISKDGVIYQSTPQGEIQKDSSGKPMIADPKKLKDDLNKLDTGFAAYARKSNGTLDVTAKERTYQVEKPKVEQEATSQESITPG